MLNSEGKPMLRVDGYYLYTIGAQLRPLFQLRAGAPPAGTPPLEAYFLLFVAESALEPLLYRSVFKLRTCVRAGEELLTVMRALRGKINPQGAQNEPLDFNDTFPITQALNTFEAVLNAELAMTPLYVVTQKAGYDTSVLIEKGTACFPTDLIAKVPGAIPDIVAATRCIAFELPTAAGFHLHRANESVLRAYWDAVTNGAARPKSRNIGDYLKELDSRQKGDDTIKSALRDLKDMHRNPLIHPEHSLDSVDDAVALMNSIHNAVVHMLKAIPVQIVSTEVLAGSGPTGPSGPAS
jgi:hypothetical protein